MKVRYLMELVRLISNVRELLLMSPQATTPSLIHFVISIAGCPDYFSGISIAPLPDTGNEFSQSPTLQGEYYACATAQDVSGSLPVRE